LDQIYPEDVFVSEEQRRRIRIVHNVARRATAAALMELPHHTQIQNNEIAIGMLLATITVAEDLEVPLKEQVLLGAAKLALNLGLTAQDTPAQPN
jgi:hypothetical protein